MLAQPSPQRTYKEAVRCATTANIANLASPGVIDGVTLATNDRVLVKDQTTLSQNGIRLWTGSTLAFDLDAYSPLGYQTSAGMEVLVREGTLNAGTKWATATGGVIVPGTTNVSFTRLIPDYNAGSWRDPVGAGLLEPYRRFQTNSNTLALTSGTLFLAGLVVLPAGRTITSISFFSGGTAASVPLNQWFTLIQQSTMKTLRTTTNGTTGAWAANTLKTLSLSSTYTPTYDTLVYVGVMVQATTVPTLTGISNANANLGGTPILSSASSTGQTTTPADGTTVTSPSGNAGLFPYFVLN